MPINAEVKSENSGGSKEVSDIVTEVSSSMDIEAADDVKPNPDVSLSVSSTSLDTVKVKPAPTSSSKGSSGDRASNRRNDVTIRSSKSPRKRRIIDDEDDENDDHDASLVVKRETSSSSNLDTITLCESSDDVAYIGKKPPPTTRGLRSRSTAASPKDRPSIHDDDEDDQDSPAPLPKRPSTASGRVTKAAISATDARGAAIPKKIPRISEKDSAVESSSKKSSLLAHMAQPPPTGAMQSPSAPNVKRDHAGGAKDAKAEPKGRTTAKTETKQPTKLEPNSLQNSALGTSLSTGSTAPRVSKEQKLQNFLAAQRAKIAPGKTGVQLAEAIVMKDLSETCNRCIQNPKFELKRRLVSSRIDLSGSFLGSNLDFFDKNERGEVTLTPRPPMFPEDFPAGTKEHSLSWWGIVAPEHGGGKYSRPPNFMPRPSAVTVNGTRDGSERQGRGSSGIPHHGRPGGSERRGPSDGRNSHGNNRSPTSGRSRGGRSEDARSHPQGGNTPPLHERPSQSSGRR